MTMKKMFRLLGLLVLTGVMAACGNSSKYTYETVPGDPLKAKIYTLDNGLKVYMTVNPGQPRLQTYIAVRVGGKNDPAETTGLAHYFEHLMFKGTENFGTQNYEQEKPMLDKIEALFEQYRQTKGETERAALYHQIDSVSYEASKWAIPNEYDKLMSAIGATGTNAYTAYDMTVYQEDIPSNEIENWAKIQADRFKNAVIRGFHTELETVYEEKNMSLTKDSRKVFDQVLAALFPNHPYGTQTVLGTQEDLKNPSITNIKNYYKQWYVPNNMAICISGDIQPDSVVDVIQRYFGDMKPNNNLPELNFKPEPALTEPVVKEVFGPETAMVALGWRFPGAASREMEILNMLTAVLYNGQAGMIDLDINQQQRLLGAGAGTIGLTDYSVFLLQAYPKAGQSLEEAKEILLAEIDKLKKGDFDEALLQANVNNYKRSLQEQMESNEKRADWFVQAFVNGASWEEEVAALERMGEITKEQVIEFANTWFKDNYAVIYKRQGEDPSLKKISKPAITPIFMNRDTASAFLREIQNTPVKPIEPVFVDYKKDLQLGTAQNGIQFLYKQNEINGLFTVTYIYERGSGHDKKLSTAAIYIDYLGTDKLSSEQIKQEFYKLACEYEVNVGAEKTVVTLQGLAENMGQAIVLWESLVADAKPDAEILNNLKADLLKMREDQKSDQQANFDRLRQYGQYGAQSPATCVLSTAELEALQPEDLLASLRSLMNYQHKIVYYGPLAMDDAIMEINQCHRVPEQLIAAEKKEIFKYQETPANRVLIAPYQAPQVYMAAVSNRGEKFDLQLYPLSALYNEYFSGGMNSIVFQEMRESRGLAYTVAAYLVQPKRLKDPYLFMYFIATQNDKTGDALTAFDEIVNHMPESETAFNLAKESILTKMRTSRLTGMEVLNSYIAAQELGLTEDRRRLLFEEVQKLTLDDVKQFQEKWIQGRHYNYCVLGDETQLDMKKLSQYGTVTRLTTEEIFGY